MLKLKQEFIETVSRLFLEKYCPVAFNRILEQRKTDINDDPEHDEKEPITFAKAALHNCSLFDLISQSNEGFLTL